MDSVTQQRLLELRSEIAALRRDDESYRKHTHHTVSQDNIRELRRLRLVAIREELLTLSSRSKRIQLAPSL
jgi:hypothetical protein